MKEEGLKISKEMNICRYQQEIVSLKHKSRTTLPIYINDIVI